VLKFLKLLRKKLKNTKERIIVPYKVGTKKTKKGWPILKNEHGHWKVVAHSNTKEKAKASIRARYMHEHE
jgi:hypothetical protein